MKMVVERCFCDICHSEGYVEKIPYPVIFHTDQTDGQPCEPYISCEDMDVCEVCKEKLLTLHATGTRGRYIYRIKAEEGTP